MALARVDGFPANLVKLSGCISSIEYSHEAYGIRYYSARFETDNGQTFKLIIHPRIIAILYPRKGEHCFLLGMVRNYSSQYGKEDPSRIMVTAMMRDPERNFIVNAAEVTGVITTINKRADHYEFLIEALRMQSNYDLVQCAAWEPECGELATMIGKVVHVTGVLKERCFQYRPSDGGSEDRCIYELHIKKWELREDK